MFNNAADNQSKYKPSLVTLMTLSQSNYMLLLRLLADCEVAGQTRYFSISPQLSYCLAVHEVTRYTTVVTIEQVSLNNDAHSLKSSQQSNQASDEEQVPNQLKQLLTPAMEVRLYHDAQVIDVLSCQNIRTVKPRYDYPNKAMHQPDEKQQIQLFLKEWLQLCLAHGYEAIDITSQQQAS